MTNFVSPSGDGWEVVPNDDKRGYEGPDSGPDPDPIFQGPNSTAGRTRARVAQMLPITAA